MTYLVDTNVWSELRNRGRADAHVRAWAAAANPATTSISVVNVFELEIGVLRMERRDHRQGARLRNWLEQHVLTPLQDQILPITPAIARHAARLHVPNPRPERDALIAATALVHGLTVVTRNTTDFEPMGVAVLNPWLAAGA